VVARRLRDGDVTLHVVAQDLGKSSRSLQRQLGARRTSHRELVDEVRREIALARLGDSEESIVAVAHDLGFTTPQSFYRAFSRWTGMTPLAFRAARRSET
jgi:AraC-like DNA-binding protein